jgi:hypothetical protein
LNGEKVTCQSEEEFREPYQGIYGQSNIRMTRQKRVGYLGSFFFLTASLGLCFAQATSVEPQQTQAQLASGRYQIVFSPHARAETFMIDTETGRVWQFTTFVDLDGDPHAWMSVPRIDSDSDFAIWLPHYLRGLTDAF